MLGFTPTERGLSGLLALASVLQLRALVLQLAKLGLIYVFLGMVGGGASSDAAVAFAKRTLRIINWASSGHSHCCGCVGMPWGNLSWVHWGLPRLLALDIGNRIGIVGVGAGEVGAIR